MVPWFDFWRDFWLSSYRKPCPQPPCNLEELSVALSEHLESARVVAEAAAKNVEDARRLNEALEAIKERKRQAAESS